METLKDIVGQMSEETFATVKKVIIADYSVDDLLLLLSYRKNCNENLFEIFNWREDYLELLNINLYVIIQRILLELNTFLIAV